jgi:hypothetical protein
VVHFPQNEAAAVRFPHKLTTALLQLVAVSLVELRAVKLQTLQEMKFFDVCTKAARLLSSCVTKNYPTLFCWYQK